MRKYIPMLYFLAFSSACESQQMYASPKEIPLTQEETTIDGQYLVHLETLEDTYREPSEAGTTDWDVLDVIALGDEAHFRTYVYSFQEFERDTETGEFCKSWDNSNYSVIVSYEVCGFLLDDSIDLTAVSIIHSRQISEDGELKLLGTITYHIAGTKRW